VNVEAGIAITERGRRLIQGLAAAACALGAIAIGAIPLGGSDESELWTVLQPEAALAVAPCPSDTSIAVPTVSPSTIEDARARRFEVFGPKPVELSDPVDWHLDPLDAERFRQNLHKLRFLDPLISSYMATGNTDDLGLATAIGLDWVRNNPRGKRDTPQEAWTDKVVGDRAPYLAYLLRAGACEGLLAPADQSDLLASMDQHGRVLAAERNYTPDNHGLFVDLGLARLTSFLPFLEQSPEWRTLARDRFETTLRKRLSQGVWLEHSSAYQFLAIRPLDSMLNVLGSDDELTGLRDEMRAAGAWFVRPDGEMTQFGDSNLEPVPDWALGQGAGARAFFGAGFAFVRQPGPDGQAGYLAVTNGFHNTTHKHADELSFELYDRGVPIVNDTGLYHKDPGEIRDFVLSNRAHSGLAVDGLDLPIADGNLAYGSGLTAAGEGDGWYAIEGRNVLLKPQGVSHSRLFLYRPGVALVIADDLGSDLAHTYTRYLQLHPDIELGEGDDVAIQINAPGFGGAIYDVPGDNPAVRSQARDQEAPLQGLTSPDFREWLPRWTLAFVNTGATETRALTIALDDNALRATGATTAGKTTTVELADAAGATSTVEVTRDRRRLTVSESP
jgi:Heparinase II/III-like protein/Heparinase II/III N-terminus